METSSDVSTVEPVGPRPSRLRPVLIAGAVVVLLAAGGTAFALTRHASTGTHSAPLDGGVAACQALWSSAAHFDDLSVATLRQLRDQTAGSRYADLRSTGTAYFDAETTATQEMAKGDFSTADLDAAATTRPTYESACGAHGVSFGTEAVLGAAPTDCSGTEKLLEDLDTKLFTDQANPGALEKDAQTAITELTRDLRGSFDPATVKDMRAALADYEALRTTAASGALPPGPIRQQIHNDSAMVDSDCDLDS